MAFQVASGNAQRMRADVSELVYRARAVLLLAARKPSSHRSLITFAACQCLAHASVMAVQTVEAWKHGVHRQFGDVVLFGVIGGILLALLLARREQAAVVPQ
jgi:hypothetical protein